MEGCAGLPRKQGVHFDPRVVHQSEVVDVDEFSHVDQGVDGDDKDGEDDGGIQREELNGTHGYCRVSCRRMVPEEDKEEGKRSQVVQMNRGEKLGGGGGGERLTLTFNPIEIVLQCMNRKLNIP